MPVQVDVDHAVRISILSLIPDAKIVIIFMEKVVLHVKNLTVVVVALITGSCNI